MGYGVRGNYGFIKTYWPDDTDTELYFSDSISLSDILDTVKDKWPETDFDDIEIGSEYIHTDHLKYDLYDPSDYTEFVVVSRSKP